MKDLWLNTTQRLAKIYLNSNEEAKFKELIKEIKESDQFLEAQGQKGSSSLVNDVLSLEI